MTDNAAQMAAHSYVLPALDTEYILGDSARGVRFLLEYQKAEELLRAWGVRSTVVVFGSARVMPGGSGDPNATTATMPRNATPRPGRSSARWYDQARQLARIVSERGGALAPSDGIRDNVIATGGGPGIMEAANRGAQDAGAPSIGFNIQLPHEQEPNAYSTPDLTFQFHYFAMRKMHFAMRAAALIVFPGGFGTFDELFEMVTLVQTGKMRRIPIVCFDREYWSKAVNLKMLAEEEFVAPVDLDLFQYADDAEEAWSALVGQGLTIPPARGVEPRKDVAP